MHTSKHNWRKRLLRLGMLLAVLAVVAYLGISGYAAYKITHPAHRPVHTTPEPYGMAYENVAFPSVPDGVPIEGWFMDSPGTRTILVLHGAGSVRDNFLNMEVGRILYQHSYDLLMFDFRAHGGSGGEVSSIGDLETRDIAGALAYLKGRGVTQVGAIGWSMGAATLINVAPSHPEIAAIVADSTFASLMSIVGSERERFGAPAFFDPGIILMTRLMYGIDLAANQPQRAITQLGNRPILLIHAAGDPLIPASNSEEIARAGAANPNLQLWIVPTIGHVASFSTNEEQYMEKVIHFFDSSLQGSGAWYQGSEGDK